MGWVAGGTVASAGILTSSTRGRAREASTVSQVAAAALRCLGGEIFARLAPRNDEERQEAIDKGYDLSKILTTRDLVGGEDIFFAATGVTDGGLLKGVRFGTGRISTWSLSMRARSGTIRFIQTQHDPDRSTLVARGVAV